LTVTDIVLNFFSNYNYIYIMLPGTATWLLLTACKNLSKLSPAVSSVIPTTYHLATVHNVTCDN